MLLAAPAAAVVLTACGASAPPAKELAIEVIDSMVTSGEISEAVAVCMREKVGTYSGDELDEIAERANGGNTDALADLDEFQADLAACMPNG